MPAGPDGLTQIAWLALWPLAAASCCIGIYAVFAAAFPGRFGRRVPWGVFAAVEWLYAVDIVVLAMQQPPLWRGVVLVCAAWRVWVGWGYYRRWEDDDDQRPRRRRRVWRLAKAGA